MTMRLYLRKNLKKHENDRIKEPYAGEIIPDKASFFGCCSAI